MRVAGHFGAQGVDRALDESEAGAAFGEAGGGDRGLHFAAVAFEYVRPCRQRRRGRRARAP